MASSPICTVNGNSAVNGVNVTAGATVTIQLANLANAKIWSLECIGADNLNDAATITAALSFNYTTKTATFTAPSTDGAALIFRSKLNNGTDINGRTDASLSTTFGVYVLTSASQRVVAHDETTEGNSTHGWSERISSALRLAGSAYTLTSTAPVGVAASTAVVGVGTTAARHDHAHAHGSQTTATHHAVATTSAHGFMSSTDKTKVDGLCRSVKQDGATGLGVADDTAAVQATLDAVKAAGGGEVYFPPGTYRISAITLTSADGIKIRGASRYATTLICTTTTADWITMTSCNLIEFGGFEIRMATLATVKTAGSFFKVTSLQTCVFHDLRLNGPFQCFDLRSCGGIYLRNIKVLPGSTASTWSSTFFLQSCGGMFFRDVDVNFGSNVTFSNGCVVLDSGCDTIYFNQCNFSQLGSSLGAITGGHSVRLTHSLSPSSFAPRWIKFSQCAVEPSNGSGIRIESGNNVELHDCYLVTGARGVQILGGSNLKFFGGVIAQMESHGVDITAGTDIEFAGTTIAGVSHSITNTSDCINIGGTAKRVHVHNCVLGDATTLGAVAYSARYGIAATTGSDDDTADHVFSNNRFGSLIATANVLRNIQRTEYGTRFVAEKSSVPTAGRWTAGDIVFNSAPADGSPSAWICSASGTFGGSAPTFRVLSYATSLAAQTSAPTVSSLMSRANDGTTQAVNFQAGTGAPFAVYGALGFSVGTSPAASGLLRGEKNAGCVSIRNAANGADLLLVKGDGLDNCFYGSESGSSGLLNAIVGADTTSRLRVAGTDRLLAYSDKIDTTVPVQTDTVNEHTSANGVTIDGLLIKDGQIPSKYNDYFCVRKVAADGDASGLTTEFAIAAPTVAITVIGAWFLPDAALTADNSNNATLKIWKRDANGVTQTGMLANTTSISGTGNWTAFKRVSLGAVSNAGVVAGGTITGEISAKGGAGVVVPAGTWIVEYRVD